MARLSGTPETQTEQKPKRQIKNNNNTEANEILGFLNEKTGRNYREVPANLSKINARLKEYSATQLRQVIAKKCREWGSDERMNQYLRPATLFNAEKCAQYVGELGQQEINHG